jgi:N6-adenosine-specific RNA methylase IME4
MLTNDNLKSEALVEFLTKAFSIQREITHPNTALYCFHASRTQREFEQALNASGYEVKQQLVWNKGMSLGRSDYHWAHEPMFYCKKKGQTTK